MKRLDAKIICLLTANLLILFGAGSGTENMALAKLLPQRAGLWTASGADQVFSRTNIFDYLDGGGEVYLGYDFRELLVREFEKPGEGPIVAEVYDMGSASEAFGIFTHDSDGENVDCGQGALYGAGLLRFWKDSCFVRILADKETAESKKAVMELGAAIAKAIPGTGEKPRLVSCLPEAGIIARSVRYFHTQVSLNNHLYLSDANILGLGRETEVALARYPSARQKAALLIVRYKDESRAGEAFGQFSRAAKDPHPEWGEGHTAEQAGKFIVAVFDEVSKEKSRNLIGRTLVRIKEAYDGK